MELKVHVSHPRLGAITFNIIRSMELKVASLHHPPRNPHREPRIRSMELKDDNNVQFPPLRQRRRIRSMELKVRFAYTFYLI